ncbi:MAG: hypothetical protein ABI885_11595 [Gammaproteobacteria bacterium]
MLRRLSAILVICVGLLTIGGPAAACALASATSDCCPTNGQPCDDGGSGTTVNPGASACCFTAPTPGTAATAEAPRARASLDLHASGPDSCLPLAWLLTLHPWESIASPAIRPPDSRAADASLTYLHTLRLRL